RDFHVTGVQTCALPISDPWVRPTVSESAISAMLQIAKREPQLARAAFDLMGLPLASEAQRDRRLFQRARIAAVIDPKLCADALQIGRASCRERARRSAA